MKKLTIFLCIIALTLSSCHGGKKASDSIKGNSNDTVPALIHTDHATGFTLTYQDGICLLDIQDPQKEESQSFHYALVRKGARLPESIDTKEYTRLEIPVSSVICMTSLQLSNFIKLGATDAVKGITSTRHLFNEEMNSRLEDGRTHKIGIEGNFDNEVIMGINPELILISPFKRGGYEALKSTGITLVPHLGYKETTPLGQAEWIKFVGLLLGQEEKANQIFADIEKKYLDLVKLASDAQPRPVVFSGELQGGNWYAVGGESFLARIFKDAGGDYFMKDDTHSGGVTKDFEEVYSQAANADYWRIVNSYQGTFTYDVLAKDDTRYTDFKAFKEHGIVYCNMSEKPFYESMPMEPELVLSDFIKVFHPELLPDYEPHYYELLK